MVNNNRQLHIFDGLKSSLLWDESTNAWTYASGGPVTPMQERYQAIPTLFRGVNIIANSVAKMPFKIYSAKGTDEQDNSQDYANKVGFLPNPRKLFSIISMSLDLTGKAYLRPLQNEKLKGNPKYTKELTYQNPTTITPTIEQGKLVGFKRDENGQTKTLGVEEIIYLWLPDPYVELGPPTAYPAQAANASTKVLGNLDSYVALYFERGAVRPVIVSVKGMPSSDERERMETFFQKLMGGIKRAFQWKVFNADSVDIKQIGDGLESLKDTELTAEKRQDVAHALGIPYAILFSEAANYATMKGDQINLYEQTIEPRCEFIAANMNDQLFIPAGYRLEFQPESLDIYQEDENERSQALTNYVDAGFEKLMACDILGIELTEEQRAELEAEKAEKKKRSEEMAKLTALTPKTPEQQHAQPGEQPPNNQSPQLQQAQQDNKSMSGDMHSEIGKWYKVTCKAIRAGKPVPEFESMIIPPGLHGALAGALETATTIDDAKRVFADLFQEH